MRYLVVTGAAGGIGAACTELLLKRGYGVVATDLPRAKKPATALLENCVYIPADVSDEKSVQELAQQVRQLQAPVQGLICCAGKVLAKPLLETSLSEWKTVQAVNTEGVFLCLREFAALMVEQQPRDPKNSRAMVVISSNAAKVPRVEFGAYGATKAAAARLASSFGLQLAPHGIRVNTVCPGTTRTPMVTADWAGEDRSAIPITGSPESFRLGIPLGRIAEPADIAEVACFLIGSGSRHMTCQDITVDGGATF